jgi:hypothetical protein
MSKVVTVEVIKSHDGIQCGRILRHTEAPWLKDMIAKGYYKVISETETTAQKTTKKSKKK